jgi:hypothetical protein
VRLALLILICSSMAQAVEVQLAAPLTTIIPLADHAVDERFAAITATVIVPANAPDDLGIGAFFTDDDGIWFQRLHPQALTPGRHHLRFDFSSPRSHGQPHTAPPSPPHRHDAERGGLFVWSSHANAGTITVADLRCESTPTTDSQQAVHELLRHGGSDHDNGDIHAHVGERLTWTFRPTPFPADPFSDQHFNAWLEVDGPQGQQRINAYYRQPMTLIDRGDAQEAEPRGRDHFACHLRPALAGTYRVTLHARWANGHTISLPPWILRIDGDAALPMVEVDPDDPRFFRTADGAFHWPLGLNARSVNDIRCAERTGTRLSPDRGWFAYRDYLTRWAAHDIDAIEVWMSSWNLALEWHPDWPGYHGIGRYNQANAEALDRLLDHAWSLGIRINLVIRNHGQASIKTDLEWPFNPWSEVLPSARDFFTDPRALAGQDQLRRYIIARWADHPAILGWKLWTEINLTAADPHRHRRGQPRGPIATAWHRQAAARWRELDPYGHPVTTHWSGDYQTPASYVELCHLDDINFLSIDAYHPPNADLTSLLWDGLHSPGQGLKRFAKAVLVSEFGGNWNACPPALLAAEHRYAPWVALVSGYAGAPMLWWMEWVDQGERFAPYQAIRRFIDGEDLRSRSDSAAKARSLTVHGANRPLRCHAWVRPGRILGHVIDAHWSRHGETDPAVHDARVTIGPRVPAGAIKWEWWDADRGEVIKRGNSHHPGGHLELPIPPLTTHLAFKLWRRE